MIENISTVSYTLAAALFVILSVLMLTSWRGRLQGGLLVSATSMTAIWATVVAVYAWALIPPYPIVFLAEVLRDVIWFTFLVRLLMVLSGSKSKVTGGVRASVAAIAIITLPMLLLFMFTLLSGASLPTFMGADIRVVGFVMLSIVGMMLVEQLLRNTPIKQRWAIKYLCLGVGGMFAYDFVLYSDALLFKQVNADLWGARGIINALVVPLIAISARHSLVKMTR